MQEGRQLLAHVSGWAKPPLTFLLPVLLESPPSSETAKGSHRVPLSSVALGTENGPPRLPLWLSAVLADNAVTISARDQHTFP